MSHSKPFSLQPTLTRRQKVIYVFCVSLGVIVVTLGWSFTTLSAIRNEFRQAKDHAGQTVESTRATADREGNLLQTFRSWVTTTKDQTRKNFDMMKTYGR